MPPNETQTDSDTTTTFEDRIAAARLKLGSETCAWLDEALRCFIIEPGDGTLKDRAEFLEIMVGIVDNAKAEQQRKIERLRDDRETLQSRLSSAENHFDEMGPGYAFRMLTKDVRELTR